MSTCKRCGAPVRYAWWSHSGQLFALDPAPHPNGAVVFISWDRIRFIRHDERTRADRYIGHVTSCKPVE